MEKVTDRASNPFGIDVPCAEIGGRGEPVMGYGDPNGDVHVVGDHPGRHGGAATGVPFTGTAAADRLQGVLAGAGLASVSRDTPVFDDLYASYLYPCLPGGVAGGDGEGGPSAPSEGDYAAAERFFDAEFRAVNAHVVLPVGERPVRHVLATYTNRGAALRDVPLADLHATEVRGRGFLVVPVAEPASWTTDDEGRLRRRLAAVLSSDYRQTKGVATRIG